MWIWTYLLLALAIVSGLFGFGGIVASATLVARFTFATSMVLFIVTVIVELSRTKRQIPVE